VTSGDRTSHFTLSHFLATAEQTRREFATPLRLGRERKIQVRLLGGLLIWLTSLYCAPRRRSSLK